MKLKKRNGIYYVDLRFLGRGRRSLFTSDPAVAKARAASWLRGIESTNTPEYTLRQLISKSLSEHYEPSKPKGIAGHRSTLNTIERDLGWDMPVKDLTLGRLVNYQRQMQAAGALAPATINKRFSYIGKVMALAVQWEMIPVAPTMPIRLPAGTSRHRELSQVEQVFVRRFFGRDEVWWMRHLVTFLVETGCRLGEAMGIRPEQRTSALECKALMITDEQSKSGRGRTIPLTDKAVVALGASDWWGGHTKRAAQYQWDLVRAELGLTQDSGFVLHCLRHTCASRMVQAGDSLSSIATWLGHSSTQVTERYARANLDNLQDIRNRMNGEG